MTQVVKIEFWLIDQTDEELASGMFDWLSSNERSRGGSFVDRRHAVAYTARHGALRAVIGGRLGISPRSVPLLHTESGRPYLGIDGAPHVGLSASGRLAVVALCDSVPIGVDIEARRQHDDLPDLAERFLSREERRLIDSLRERMRVPFDLAFLQVWTMKEAYLKALGQGIDRLQDFSLAAGGPDGGPVVVSRKLDEDPHEMWTLSSHVLPGDFSLTFAAPGPGIVLERRAFDAWGPDSI